jgi:phosphonoacetate hydrolase
MSDAASSRQFAVNGITYDVTNAYARTTSPVDGKARVAPVVGICIDGCAEEYLTEAKEHMPNFHAILERERAQGNFGLVNAVMPTYTNPNNVAIITGVGPDKNGICGNYYYDAEKDEEVSMVDPELIRCETILERVSALENTRVVTITAKDKLRRMLSKGLSAGSFGVSVEKCLEEEAVGVFAANGIPPVEELMEGKPVPGIYDPEISIYALEMGLQMMQKCFDQDDDCLSIYYLSTTDFVQHKYAPGTPEANAFYAGIDRVLGEMDKFGCVIGLTADHGMNDKLNYKGEAKIVFLSEHLNKEGISHRTVLPITDPYMLHHSGLGGYATIYLDDNSEEAVNTASQVLRAVPGVYAVLNHVEAVKSFDLPGDRIGDLVLVGDKNTVLGKTHEDHDLTRVPDLRSHGSLEEQLVPIWTNRPMEPLFARRLTRGKLRNYHLFEMLLGNPGVNKNQA